MTIAYRILAETSGRDAGLLLEMATKGSLIFVAQQIADLLDIEIAATAQQQLSFLNQVGSYPIFCTVPSLLFHHITEILGRQTELVSIETNGMV